MRINLSGANGVRVIQKTVLVGCLLTLPFIYQNCSSPSVTEASNNSVAATSPLTIASTSTTTPVGSTVQLVATGGTPPYTFSVASTTVGTVTTTSPNGFFYATAQGQAIVTVTDATGSMNSTTITVTDSSTSGTSTSTSTGVTGTTTYVAPVPIYRFRDAYGRHFFTSNYTEGFSAGMAYEGQPFVFISGTGYSGTTPVYRCYMSQYGVHFVSSNSSNCGGYSYEGTYGSLYYPQTSNSVPLYQFYSPGLIDFLVTTSQAEGYGLGYQYQGIVGYVPVQ